MELHLVRHGHHPDGFRGGWSQHGLSDLGRRQAWALAERLGLEGWTVDNLISSDLPRAVQTALPVARRLGRRLWRDAAWREVNNGVLAGMPNREVERRFPGLYWDRLAVDEAYPGGESPRQFQARVAAAWERLQARLDAGEVGPRLMLVTHGGVIKVLHALLTGYPYAHNVRNYTVALASLHSFVRAGDHWQQVRANDTAHLAGMAQPGGDAMPP